MWYELTRWLSYRKVSHPQMKWYLWILPCLTTFVIVFPVYFFHLSSTAFVKDGLVDGLTSMLSLLPGFFFAALAAVATFPSTALDKHVEEEGFSIPMRTKGVISQQPLTMRIFLSQLFSYLTAISFIALLMGIFNRAFRSLWSSGEKSLEIDWLPSFVFHLETAFLIIFIYLVSSIVFSGGHGLYFLSERIHRPSSS